MTLTKKCIQAVVAAMCLSVGSADAQSTPSICSVPPEDAFFGMFDCGRLVEVGWSANYALLDRYSKAEMHHYISAIVQEMHSQMAPFHLHPDLLVARDPRLPYMMSLKAISDKEVLDDTMSEGVRLLGHVLGTFIDERKRQVDVGTIDPLAEINSIGRGIINSGGSSILWAGKLGQHDYHVLAALSQSDPETAVAIYRALAALAERL